MIRYVHNNVVKESFVGFKDQHCEITGNTITLTIFEKLEVLCLESISMGSGSIVGMRKDVQYKTIPCNTFTAVAIIMLKFIASSLPYGVNMLGGVSEVCKFFEMGWDEAG